MSASPTGTSERSADLAAARELVRRVFGFDELRPLQGEAIAAALAGRDSLVVLATGGGKSLCYQAPALLREGLTVVVSPLISLMQDQVASLVECGVGAAMLTSAQGGFEKSKVYDMLRGGDLRLLFVAPERFAQEGFAAELASFGLAALVVDEAHCISHWGHDFRPEYRRIGELRRSQPRVPIHAFTATATPGVRSDIALQLGLRDPLVLVGDFDRPNLTYRFVPRKDVVEQTLAVVRRHPREAGIVYCLRRADVDDLAPQLARAGVRALPYHAGLDAATRELHQERFLAEEVEVIVATVAFGMGIDRPDVRFVVHAAMPKGIEPFAQETGRAGRDGLPSECVMLYSGADFHAWRLLQERSRAEAVAAGVAVDPGEAERALERVSRMYGFATSAVCRHRFLVEHFGQSPRSSGPCDACDVCLGELEPLADARRVAQMILSCVVRCGQRYGAAHVADVLRGADTERVRAAGHVELSTFGLMRDVSASEIRHCIEQLVGLGHLRVAPGRYPTLSLTTSGVAVMRAEREIALCRPPVSRKARRSTSRAGRGEAPPSYDEALFERLRALRRRLAKERGVPPYIIFGDRTLQELAAEKPSTLEALRGIRGIGEAKLADLGPIFLGELRAATGRG